jgi:hypothetical protein
MEIRKSRATGRINVTSYNAQPQDDGGAFTVADVQVTEEFFGGLVGAGSARFISAKELVNGAMHFAGIEKFLGKLGDRSGSFLMRNAGAVTGDVLHSTWHVIEGSGTEELAGLRGEGGCTPQGYTLEYWFE